MFKSFSLKFVCFSLVTTFFVLHDALAMDKKVDQLKIGKQSLQNIQKYHDAKIDKISNDRSWWKSVSTISNLTGTLGVFLLGASYTFQKTSYSNTDNFFSSVTKTVLNHAGKVITGIAGIGVFGLLANKKSNNLSYNQKNALDWKKDEEKDYTNLTNVRSYFEESNGNISISDEDYQNIVFFVNKISKDKNHPAFDEATNFKKLIEQHKKDTNFSLESIKDAIKTHASNNRTRKINCVYQEENKKITCLQTGKIIKIYHTDVMVKPEIIDLPSGKNYPNDIDDARKNINFVKLYNKYGKTFSGSEAIEEKTALLNWIKGFIEEKDEAFEVLNEEYRIKKFRATSMQAYDTLLIMKEFNKDTLQKCLELFERSLLYNKNLGIVLNEKKDKGELDREREEEQIKQMIVLLKNLINEEKIELDLNCSNNLYIKSRIIKPINLTVINNLQNIDLSNKDLFYKEIEKCNLLSINYAQSAYGLDILQNLKLFCFDNNKNEKLKRFCFDNNKNELLAILNTYHYVIGKSCERPNNQTFLFINEDLKEKLNAVLRTHEYIKKDVYQKLSDLDKKYEQNFNELNDETESRLLEEYYLELKLLHDTYEKILPEKILKDFNIISYCGEFMKKITTSREKKEQELREIGKIIKIHSFFKELTNQDWAQEIIDIEKKLLYLSTNFENMALKYADKIQTNLYPERDGIYLYFPLPDKNVEQVNNNIKDQIATIKNQLKEKFADETIKIEVSTDLIGEEMLVNIEISK